MSKLDPDRVAAVLLEGEDGWTEIQPGTLYVDPLGFYGFEQKDGTRYGSADDLLGVLYERADVDGDD